MLLEGRLSPGKALRFICLFCFVGAGLSVIFLTSHLADRSGVFVGMEDLVSYFFAGLGIFVFFYAQYRLVPRFTKRTLNDGLGYCQALSALALLLIGVVNDLIPGRLEILPSYMLWFIALVGESVFILNVIWSYTSGHMRALTKVPERTTNIKGSDFGWPKSPVKLFGIAGIFFGTIGILSSTLGLPSFKVPLPWGTHVHLVPIGWPWLGAAIPFVIFTLLYKLLVWWSGPYVEESLARLHFAVTIIAVLGLSRVYDPGQRRMAKAWLWALLAASTVVFAINAIRTFLRSPVRS